MNEEEKKKTLAEIEVKKKELDTLKAKLDELNTQKEAALEKKKLATKDISELAKTIRESKGKRNNYTKQVKDSKLRRSELNDLLKKKRDEMRMLQKEKQTVSGKFGIRFDPAKIKGEIEDLELKIETEALPFNIEQRMMKMIAEKKRTLEQSKEVSDVFDKIHALGKDLDRIKLKADDTHRKIQTKAEASQQFHEELIESSKEVKDARAKEEEALKKFVEWKGKYTEQNELVKGKLQEIRELKAKIDGVNLEEREKVKKEEAKKLGDQKKTVEEKIKNKMKLTTEDLLAFQAKEQSRPGGKGKRKAPAKPKKENKKEEPKPAVKKEKPEPKAPEPAPTPEEPKPEEPKEAPAEEVKEETKQEE
ncbi:hypothetical protein ACFL3V_06415 [Nanoarchaeota archaeon]